jgi:CheY-like chemotaxis protein
MNDPGRLAEASLRACGEELSPLVGVALEPGPCRVEKRAEPPEGDLAVQPMRVEIDGEALPPLALAVPILPVAALGRRMLGDPDPDKERELGAEDLAAIAEILGTLAGAVDRALGAWLGGGGRARPLDWWRTSEPAGNKFEDGEHLLARGSLTLPGGAELPLWLRLPQALLARAGGAGPSGKLRVVLAGFEEAASKKLAPALEAGRAQVTSVALEAPVGDELARADVVLAAEAGDRALAFCKRLRHDDRTWTVPVVLTLAEPTREQVLRALEAGAFHVVKGDEDPASVMRVLRRAKA